MSTVRSSILLVAAGLPTNPLNTAVLDMNGWLDAKNIKPVDFRTVAGEGGLGFEIVFRKEDEAVRFVHQFRSLIDYRALKSN